MTRHARPRAPSKPVSPTPAPNRQETETTVQPIRKSDKLANVCYDIRGPVLQKAKQMEDEGHKIIKLNIGNLAAFGFEVWGLFSGIRYYLCKMRIL
jgi:alanine-synthesizing transaminase